MRFASRPRNAARIASLAALLGACMLFWQCPTVSAAQRGKSGLRVVHGTVVDRNENSVNEGIVYLKNVQTGAVKTYISNSQGKFRFSGVDPNADYQIYAQHAKLCSPLRTISSFDSRMDIDITLKLSRSCGK